MTFNPATLSGHLGPITITKNLVQCNNSLIVDIFRRSGVSPALTATIVFSDKGSTVATYTLSNVIVTSFVNDALEGYGFDIATENGTATLAYNAITVDFPALHISYTCSAVSKSCS